MLQNNNTFLVDVIKKNRFWFPMCALLLLPDLNCTHRLILQLVFIMNVH